MFLATTLPYLVVRTRCYAVMRYEHIICTAVAPPPIPIVSLYPIFAFWSPVFIFSSRLPKSCRVLEVIPRESQGRNQALRRCCEVAQLPQRCASRSNGTAVQKRRKPRLYVDVLFAKVALASKSESVFGCGRSSLDRVSLFVGARTLPLNGRLFAVAWS